jgi:hypothetical protein
MPSQPWPSIRVDRMRITKEDVCGVPVIGPATTTVSDGFASIAISPQYEEGTETVAKNANGKIDWVDKPKDELKYLSVNIVFNKVHPDIFATIMGQPIVLDGAGNSVGIRLGDTVRTAFGLEGWTNVPGVACVESEPFGYVLLPFLRGGRLADFTLSVEQATFTIENSITQQNSPWGKGPYDVDLQAPVAPATVGVPGKLLTAIGAKHHIDMHKTLVAPPALTDGAVALAA